MGELTTFIDLITRGGLVTALIIALIGGMRGWYVWKDVHEDSNEVLKNQLEEMKKSCDKQLDDIIKDRNYWRDQAVRSMTNNGRITDVTEAIAASRHTDGKL